MSPSLGGVGGIPQSYSIALFPLFLGGSGCLPLVIYLFLLLQFTTLLLFLLSLVSEEDTLYPPKRSLLLIR